MAKKAGRPVGSGIPEGAILDRVAEMIVKGKAKTPNAAMMAIYRKDRMTEPSENYRRRISRKWSRQSEERLAVARERQRERTCPVEVQVRTKEGVTISSFQIGAALAARQAEMAEIAAAFTVPHSLHPKVGDILKNLSPAAHAFEQMTSSGVVGAIQRMQDDGVLGRLRAFEDALPAFCRANDFLRLTESFDTRRPL